MTFDVTKHLQANKNTIGVILGNGRYFGMREGGTERTKSYGFPKMICQLEVEYEDGTADSLVLHNPETWWPIEKDYYTDGFAFKLKQPRPIRIHLKSGTIVSSEQSYSKYNGKEIEGGAATILDLPLDPTKKLKQLVLKTIANDVVIGLMGLTLLR
jgi:hypothetical protein